MATWLCHLLAARRAADLCGSDAELCALYLGSLAPDWSGLVGGVQRRDSHFKTTVPGEYLVDAFVREYCLDVDDPLVRAFRWGYAGHLMVDRLWAVRLYIPVVMNDAGAKEAYRTDIRAVDRELSSDPGAPEALDLLRSARCLEAVLDAGRGLVETEELGLLLEAAGSLYRKPWPEGGPAFLDAGAARDVVRQGGAELRGVWQSAWMREA